MENLRQGYWNKDIASRRESDVFLGSSLADTVIVGGGLSGMWAAYDIHQARPKERVVILERDYLGFGPSGRSGGIVYDFWHSLPRLQRSLGAAAARRLARFSEKLRADIESLPDIEWKEGGALHISTAPAYDGASLPLREALRAAGREDLFQILSREEISERTHSPRWRGGVLYPRVATVHPAKLVRALRQKIEDEGVEIYEGSEVVEVSREHLGWKVRTLGGVLFAKRVLLATGAAGNLLPRGIVPSSSHMIVTEPLLDIENYWPGDEAITDERSTVRYMRKTADRRVAFGWGWGRADFGQNLRRGDPQSGETVAAVFRQFFPQWEGREIEYSWGGPIDISPTHLPLIYEAEKGLWSVAGYTGNGIGPTRTVGKIIASRMLGLDDEAASFRLPRPPIPLPQNLQLLGNITREALLRKEHALERGQRPKHLARFLSALPGKLGIELGR